MTAGQSISAFWMGARRGTALDSLPDDYKSGVRMEPRFHSDAHDQPALGLWAGCEGKNVATLTGSLVCVLGGAVAAKIHSGPESRQPKPLPLSCGHAAVAGIGSYPRNRTGRITRMILTKTQCSRLLDGLEKVGWHRRGDFLYAPHETMWLLISEPWSGGLQDFHERMIGRLQLIKGMRTHQSVSEYQKCVDDVTGLIQVLTAMILDESHAAQPPLSPDRQRAKI